MTPKEKLFAAGAGLVGLAAFAGVLVASQSAAAAPASLAPPPPAPPRARPTTPGRPDAAPAPSPLPAPAGSLAAGDGARFLLAHPGDRNELVRKAHAAGILRIPSSAPVRVSPRLVVSAWIDTLALGHERPIRVPVTHRAAESLARLLGGHLLPCPAIARAIARATPSFAPPRPFKDLRGMESVERAVEYAANVEAVAGPWREFGAAPVGTLGKDYLNAWRLLGRPDRCCIGGWWTSRDGEPIQPVSTKHGLDYVDYSHTFRLVADRCELDGKPASLAALYRDPEASKAAGLWYGLTNVDGSGLLPVGHPGVIGKGIFA